MVGLSISCIIQEEVFVQFVVVLTTDGDGCSATWTSLTHHFSDGTTAEGGTPITTLRNLAKNLQEADKRQSAINAIDYEDD